MQGLHGVATAREQAAPGFGQFDAAGVAGKERQADVLFQGFQRLADRWCGDFQFARGGGDAAFAGDGLEDADLVVKGVVHGFPVRGGAAMIAPFGNGSFLWIFR